MYKTVWCVLCWFRGVLLRGVLLQGGDLDITGFNDLRAEIVLHLVDSQQLVLCLSKFQTVWFVVIIPQSSHYEVVENQK